MKETVARAVTCVHGNVSALDVVGEEVAIGYVHGVEGIFKWAGGSPFTREMGEEMIYSGNPLILSVQRLNCMQELFFGKQNVSNVSLLVRCSYFKNCSLGKKRCPY